MVVVALLSLPYGVFAQTSNVFSLPDSTSLFGSYNELRIVTPHGSETIVPPVEVGTNHGYFVEPVLSPRGNLIAWGFARELDTHREKYQARFTLGIYSIQSHQWKTYGDFDEVGSLSFSSDGDKVMFLAKKHEETSLLIFDVARAEITRSSYIAQTEINTTFPRSWSLDGRRFLLEIKKAGSSSIAILDAQTSVVTFVTRGSSPTWSPDSTWIAYFDPSGSSCSLIRSDGTGQHMVEKLRQGVVSYKRFGIAPPVWSPDGKHLLLTEMKGDGDFMDDVVFDIDGHKESKKEHNTLAIYGWSVVAAEPAKAKSPAH